MVLTIKWALSRAGLEVPLGDGVMVLDRAYMFFV